MPPPLPLHRVVERHRRPTTRYQRVEDVLPVRQGRSGRGSSPSPRRRRSPARTSRSRRRRRRPPRALGAGSAIRTRGRRRSQSSAARPWRGRALRRRRRNASTRCLASSRLTKKSLVRVPGRSVRTPCCDCPTLAFSARSPPISAVISGAVRFSMYARSRSSVLQRHRHARVRVVAEPVELRLEHGERFDVRLLLRRVGPPGREGDGDVVAGVLRRLLDGGGAGEDDQVGERDLLRAGLRVVEFALDALEGREHRARARPAR